MKLSYLFNNVPSNCSFCNSLLIKCEPHNNLQFYCKENHISYDSIKISTPRINILYNDINITIYYRSSNIYLDGYRINIKNLLDSNPSILDIYNFALKLKVFQ